MIVFVKPDWNYDSYTDFWSLVKLSDYPIIRYNQIDPSSSNIYIVAPANGQLQDHINSIRSIWDNKICKLMLWNLERPGNGIQNHINDNKQLIEQGFLDRVLVSDMQLSKDTGFHYIPLGSHPGLGYPGMFKEKHWDMVHLMCYSNRRASPWFIDPGIIRDGIDRLSVAPNGWGDVKDASLKYSRFMVNVHQDDYPFCEPLRFALAAAYGLPIVTEHCTDISPYDNCRTVFQCAKDNIVNTVKTLLRSYPALYHETWWFRDRYTKHHTFRSYLEENI